MSWYDRSGINIRPFTSDYADEYLTPGQVYRFDIRMSEHLWSVKPGHALRLRLATQTARSHCQADVIDSAPCFHTAPQLLTLAAGSYQILSGPDAPSALYLPLLPYHQLATAGSGVTPTSSGVAQPLDWGSGYPYRGDRAR